MKFVDEYPQETFDSEPQNNFVFPPCSRSAFHKGPDYRSPGRNEGATLDVPEEKELLLRDWETTKRYIEVIT